MRAVGMILLLVAGLSGALAGAPVEGHEQVLLEAIRVAGHDGVRLRPAGSLMLIYLGGHRASHTTLSYENNSKPRSYNATGLDLHLPSLLPSFATTTEPPQEHRVELPATGIPVDGPGRLVLDVPLSHQDTRGFFLLNRAVLPVERVDAAGKVLGQEELTIRWFDREDPGRGCTFPRSPSTTRLCAVTMSPGGSRDGRVRGLEGLAGDPVCRERELGLEPRWLALRPLLPARDGGWIENPVKHHEVRNSSVKLARVSGRELGLRNDLSYDIEGKWGSDGVCELSASRTPQMKGYVPARRGAPVTGPGIWAPPLVGDVWEDGVWRDAGCFLAVYRGGQLVSFRPDNLLRGGELWTIHYVGGEPWAALCSGSGRSWHRTLAAEWPERYPVPTGAELALWRSYAQVAGQLWRHFGARLQEMGRP